MAEMQQQGLLRHLQAFLTPERRQRIEQVLDVRTRHVTVVLENVYHPHNISAVLRSCDAFGVQDVHIIEGDDSLKVKRDIAVGADRWLTIHRHGSLGDRTAACLERLRADGYRLLVTLPDSEGSAGLLAEIDLSRPVALVFGHEKTGVSEQFIAAADETVTIPMCGFTDSLNLSVAAAICLQQLTERLRQSNVAWRLPQADREQLRFQWTRQSVRHCAEIEKRFLQAPSQSALPAT